jgi:CDP-paratose 2-epimerase
LRHFVHGDVRSRATIDEAVARCQPDAILHFAGQVAMAASLADPVTDFEINALGTLNVLEAASHRVRITGRPLAILYASTNKVYGDLENLRYIEMPTRYVAADYPNGLPETLPLDFRTPYGCSKGAADQMVLDYGRRQPGLACTVFRHSSMYGPRQFATETQGWIGWFCSRAVLASRGRCPPFSVSGHSKQVRDLLHSDDMVRLYRSALANRDAVAGKAYVVGGGPRNAMSVLELLRWLERHFALRLDWHSIDARASDQKVFIADLQRLTRDTDWSPRIDHHSGLQSMLEWCESIVDLSD